MNEYTYADMSAGMTASFSHQVTEDMEAAFRRLTGDENPLHKDDGFARSVPGGYLQHVSFGMLTASLYSTLAGMYLPGKFSLIHSIDALKFLRPVYAGDTLTVSGTVQETDDALRLLLVRAAITNQNGERVSTARMKVLVLA